MSLLLDTHVMLWWAFGDERLGRAGRVTIEQAGGDVAVSVASLWEVAIKSRLERPGGLDVSTAAFAALVDEAAYQMLPVERRHALAVAELPRLHGDPFDRLLVATAIADGRTLLTHDRALAAYGDAVMLV